MKRISHIFDDHRRLHVNRAVAAAESKTAAEIVPVVARASGRYDRAEDLFAASFAAVIFTIAWILFQREDPAAGGWDGLPLTLQLPVLLGILIIAFIAGAILATFVPILRRPFHTRREMKDNVGRAATMAAFDQRVHHAPGDAGVLIYISLYEKLAVIIADDRALSALGGRDGLDAAATSLIARLKAAHPSDALSETIISLGDSLAKELPREEDDQNEMPDALVMIE